jgi:transposase
MITLALDVHVRNSFVKARDPDGRVLARGRVGNSLLELSQALAGVEQAARDQAQPVYAVLESTTNSRAIGGLLRRWGQQAGLDLKVDVLASRKLKVIAQSVSKCDRLDTAVLLELAESNLRLPTCYMPDDPVFWLRELLRGRHDLVKVRTTVKNRVHALLHRRGILSPTRLNLFSQAGRAYLQQLELDDVGGHLREQFLAAVDRLDELVNEADRRMRAAVSDPRWRTDAAFLDTVPGLGPVTILTILSELGDIHRFAGRDAVANYAGLVPVVRDSNQKVFRGGLVRSHGNRHLRSVLIEAAWQSCARVPVYEDQFERIAARAGKATAIVAVARRMLEDCWTMLKKQEPFRYAQRPQPAAASLPSGEAVPRLA